MSLVSLILYSIRFNTNNKRYLLKIEKKRISNKEKGKIFSIL